MEMQEQFRDKIVQDRNKTRYGRGNCFRNWILDLKDAGADRYAGTSGGSGKRNGDGSRHKSGKYDDGRGRYPAVGDRKSVV